MALVKWREASPAKLLVGSGYCRLWILRCGISLCDINHSLLVQSIQPSSPHQCPCVPAWKLIIDFADNADEVSSTTKPAWRSWLSWPQYSGWLRSPPHAAYLSSLPGAGISDTPPGAHRGKACLVLCVQVLCYIHDI